MIEQLPCEHEGLSSNHSTHKNKYSPCLEKPRLTDLAVFITSVKGPQVEALLAPASLPRQLDVLSQFLTFKFPEQTPKHMLPLPPCMCTSLHL
jgi:hypothetical protein